MGGPAQKGALQKVDPVTVGVIQELFVSIVREMRVTFSRGAFSSIISEGHDFSCALLSPEGELIAQSEDHPGHIFPLVYAAQAVLQRYAGDIHPGDIFIINDPYICGTHMNDVAVFCPRFSAGRALIFPAIRAHWGDVGGSVAGSLSSNATHIFQEGTVIPPLRLYSKGELNRELLELMLANMRGQKERRGDLMAAIGTCGIAARRLNELETKYHGETLLNTAGVLLDRAEQRMRKAIRTWPDGVYYAENYMDNSGSGAEPLRISLRLEISEDRLHCDFAGTSGEVKGPMNCGLATTLTGCLMVLKSYLDPRADVNAGIFRVLSVDVPERTILNARHPSPMGGASDLRRTVESTLLGAITQVVPDESCGDTKGAANHCYIAGSSASSHGEFLYYEYPAGGTGALRGQDGEHGIRTFSEGDFNCVQPVESLESRMPLLVESSGLRADSCGNGQWRGGLGMERKVRIESDGCALTVLTDRVIMPPYSICAGAPGMGNRFTVFRDHAEIEPSDLPGKATAFPLKPGDVLALRSAGGGGYGDPVTRDPASVLNDIRQGVISAELARRVYGVILSDGKVDQTSTASERERLLRERIHLIARMVKHEGYVGSRRVYRVTPSMAGRLGVGDGQLVEFVPERGVPLRAIVVVDATAPDGEVEFGPNAAIMLGLAEGQRVYVRPVQGPYRYPPQSG